MTDLKALVYEINESGLKKVFIANKLGISPASLSKKIGGRCQFTASEINGLSEILKLNKTTRRKIFYPEA